MLKPAAKSGTRERSKVTTPKHWSTTPIRCCQAILLMRLNAFVASSTSVRLFVPRWMDDRRSSIAKNHTATHLLHASLRNLIGFHVKQAGSLVAPDRLRFDFTHYAPLSPEEVIEIENLVNSVVMQNSPVTTSVKDLNEAIAEGAMALFGEKYGSHVRVVAVDTFSKELCGGTHVERTGDIGLFKVVNEGGIAAGIRRIEAITGEGALSRFREDERLISELEELARGKRSDLTGLVEKYQSSIRSLEKELEEFRYRMAKSQVQQLLQSAQIVKGVKVVTGIVDGLDKGGLRNLADELKGSTGARPGGAGNFQQ